MPRWLLLLTSFLAVASIPAVFNGIDRKDRQWGPGSGRRVYIAEGCIHCHSQYIRPETVDASLWGNFRDPDFSREQNPGLIGNRRQGPDLMNVGLRRTRDWQRLHLINPRDVTPSSRMPAYGHLFASGDPRGEALLNYLESLGRESDVAGSDTGTQTNPVTPR